MKKLFTLIAFIGLAIGANAQRNVDIEVKLISPAAGTHIISGHSLGLAWAIINHGPDTLRASDTIVYHYTVNGASATPDRHAYGTIPSGDTAYLLGDTGLAATYSGYMHDSTKSVCIAYTALITAGHIGTITDANSTNNTSCLSLVYTDVPKISAFYGDISIYPNPAQSNLNLDMNLNIGGNVSVRVLDATGRIVLSEDKGKLNAGNHKLSLNTTDLSNGIYIYQVMVDAETTTGRFSIAK